MSSNHIEHEPETEAAIGQQQQRSTGPKSSAKLRPEAANWTGLGGDCPLLRDALAPKQGLGWTFCKFLVSYVRGFSQTGFSNNPITGLILMAGLLSVGPGTFVCCASTSLLGHLVSMLLREPQVNLDNGLTVFNPLIFGAVSYYFVPLIYGPFDVFSCSLMFLCVIFIAYFWRACGNGCIPCLTMPFNVAELILLFTLKNARESQAEAFQQANLMQPMFHSRHEIAKLAKSLLMGTTDSLAMASLFIALLFQQDNGTMSTIAAIAEGQASALVGGGGEQPFDWAMIVQASVLSASQLFVVESVAFGALVYLAVLIYSPVTCLFGYLGSLVASLVALQVGSSHAAIKAGLYGFNGYLTGASLGGSFLVINAQSSAATCVAILLTGLMQHVLEIIFRPVGLPVGTMPFVLTTWLFIGLAKTPEGAFFYPLSISWPERQRRELLSHRRQAKLEQICVASEPELLLRNGKASLLAS